MKLKWKEGQYGGSSLSLAKGMVRLYVDWALVSKGEKGYYYAMVNNARLTKHFDNVDDAKAAAVQAAYKSFLLAVEQLRNFIDK